MNHSKNSSSTEDLFTELLSILEADLDILPDKDEENARNTLMALWHFASENPKTVVNAEKYELVALNKEQADVIRGLISQRLEGVPLAYLIGRQNFMGIEYLIEKGIYIPRKETELLGETAVKILKDEFNNEKINVVDICTGIGTLAIAIAYYNKNATAFGSDISDKAINCAKRNVAALQLEDSVTMLCGDLMEPLKSLGIENRVHMVLSAPPYISSAKINNLPTEIRQHEPEAAFNAGTFGLDIFNGIIKQSVDYLKDGGYLLFEVGLGQGEFLIKRLKRNKNYSSVESICDSNGDIRVLVIKK